MLYLAPITRFLRAKASSHLLAAGVLYFKVFEELNAWPQSIGELQQKLGLKERPAMVLFPALCAMGLIQFNREEKLELTDLGRFLSLSHPANLVGYVGLEKEDPGVLRMVEWLKNDGPEDTTYGLSYVKDAEAPSPMDEPEAARFFTMALAGRARYLSPIVAQKIATSGKVLLDVAGGTGYYSFEWLLANPQCEAILFDRPEVLNVAEDLFVKFCNSNEGGENIRKRLTFLAGDMLTDELPVVDIVLAASVFHDWPTAVCQVLANRFAQKLRPGGELWIHDAFLNDALDGPVAVTDYSAMLFLGTKGRAYSRKEYRQWISAAGLVPSMDYIPTSMDYGLISARKPA